MNDLPPIVQNCKTPAEVKDLAASLKNKGLAISGRRFSKGDNSDAVSIADLRQKLEQLTTHSEKIFKAKEIQTAYSEIDNLRSRPNIFSRAIHLFTSIVTGSRQRSNAAAKSIQSDIKDLSNIECYSDGFENINALLTKQHQNNSPLQTHRDLFIKSVASKYRDELKSLQGDTDQIKTLNEDFLTFLENSKVTRKEIKTLLFDAEGKAKPGALDLAKLATEKQQKKDELSKYLRGNSVLDNVRNIYAQTVAKEWIQEAVGEIDLNESSSENLKEIYTKLNQSIKDGKMPLELKELLNTIQSSSNIRKANLEKGTETLRASDPKKESIIALLSESNQRFLVFSVLNQMIPGAQTDMNVASLMATGTKILSTPDKEVAGISSEDQQAIIALQKELLDLINS